MKNKTVYLTLCPNCQTIKTRTTHPFTWEKGNVRGLKNEVVYHAFCCANPASEPLNFHGPFFQMFDGGAK